MNEMNEHTNEHLLNGFIDGELNTVEEETLFERLSMNSELRSQLHDVRAIRNTTRNYAVALIPPASLTQATFARLGFTSPVPTGVTTGAMTLLPASIIQFFKRYWLAIISIIFSSLLTTIIILSLSKDSNPGVSSNNSNPSSSQMKTGENTQQQTSTQSSAQLKTENNQQQQASPQSTASDQQLTRSNNSDQRLPALTQRPNPVTTPSRVSQPLNYIVPDNNTLPQNESVPDIMDFQNFSATEPIQNQDPQISIGQEVYQRNLFFAPNLPPDFSVEYRTLASRSYPDATISSKSDPWFSNMSIALLYALNDHHKIGLEAGQEAFPQHYSGTENGNNVRYEQNLLTQWIVAAYRYRINGFDFLGRIDPFVSVGVGATVQAWPLGRSSIGIEYSPEEHLAFRLGIDGSILFYPFQSAWFSTKKLGLTYGVSIGF